MGKGERGQRRLRLVNLEMKMRRGREQKASNPGDGTR
jgi:hypothetical protein